MTTPAWRPDPYHRHELRWWDGAEWTEHVSDHGVATVDPSLAPPHDVLPPPPGAPAPAGPPPAPPARPPAPTRPPAPVAVTAAAPPGAGGPRRETRRRWAIVGTAAAVIVLIAGLVVVTRGGDDSTAARRDRREESDRTDETDPTDRSDETVTTDRGAPPTVEPTAAPVSTVPLTLPTTVPPETVPPGTGPAETAPPATVAPATTPPFVPATPDALVAALPTSVELPFDWYDYGGEVWTGLSPASGSYVGYCAGENNESRAMSLGVRAVAFGPWFGLPWWGDTSAGIYAFETVEQASAFMTGTATQAGLCSAGIDYQLPQGMDAGEYPGFVEGAADDAIWTMSESQVPAPEAVSGADEAFAVTSTYYATTTVDGIAFAATEGWITIYERHGPIVVYSEVWGQWGLAGFSDIDPTTDYQPTIEDARYVADTFRTVIVARLRTGGMIP